MAFWLTTCLVISFRIKQSFSQPLEEIAIRNGNGNGNPVDLQINFTLPQDGLPPIKLNLGNVLNYLEEKPNIAYPPKKVVLMNIANPNKPYPPYNPGDIAKPCRSFIYLKCNEMCVNSRNGCRYSCDGQDDCFYGCQSRFGNCMENCKSSMNKKETSTQQVDYQVYLPKCLGGCKNNEGCINQCHKVCHHMLDKKPQVYSSQSNGYQQPIYTQVVNVNPNAHYSNGVYNYPSSTYKPDKM